MAKKKDTLKIKRLGTVTYTYTGTDQDFNEFLKMLLRTYLAADHPCNAEAKLLIS